MRCPKCGAPVTKRAKYCQNCGNKIRRRGTKKYILVIAAIIILGTLFFFAVSRVLSIRKTQKALEEYQKVTQIVDTVEGSYVDDRGFVAPDQAEELMKEVSSVAEQMYSDGLLTDYSYAPGDSGVYMEIDGWLGVIFSPEVEDMMSGGTEEVQIYTFEPNDGEFYANYALAGFNGPDDAASKIANSFEKFKFSHNINGKEVSIENIKKIEPNSVIAWIGHGGYLDKFGSVLCLGTEAYDQSTILIYQQEFADKAICLNGDKGFYITSVFFDKYMPEGCFDGSLVYLGACNSVTDTRLAESIANKGARAILGNSRSVNISYNFQMVYSFFEGLTTKKPDGNYMTVSDALEYAKNKNGATDPWPFSAKSEVRLGSIDDFTLPDMAAEKAADISTTDLEEVSRWQTLILPPKESTDVAFGKTSDEVSNEAPDYSLYIPVLENTIAESPYKSDGYGILYDIDKDGIDELFLIHSYLNDNAFPVAGFSIYDIENGSLSEIIKKRDLITLAGGGTYFGGITNVNGEDCFFAFGLQGGDCFANSVIEVYNAEFSLIQTFKADMTSEYVPIFAFDYTTAYSLNDLPCTEEEYYDRLNAFFSFDTSCFLPGHAFGKSGQFYNGQWYGETPEELLARLKNSSALDSEKTDNNSGSTASAYHSVLDMFCRNIQTGWTELNQMGWELENTFDPDSVSYLHYADGSTALSDIGYCIQDIDGNGVPELMVTPMRLAEEYPGLICDLYTLSGGTPVHLATSGERDRYYLNRDGRIAQEASGSAFTSIFCTYVIDSETCKLRTEDAVIYDENIKKETPWFFANTEFYNSSKTDYNYDALYKITEQEAHILLEAFQQHAEIRFTSLNQYQSEGEGIAQKNHVDEEQAREIAEAYWGDLIGSSDEIWSDFAASARGKTEYQGKEYYSFHLTGGVDGHRTSVDYLFIDAENGDCYFGIMHPEDMVWSGSDAIQSISQSQSDQANEVSQTALALSGEDRYRINIFLSNFSEQHFHEGVIAEPEHREDPCFTAQSADAMELLSFAWHYAKINQSAYESISLENSFYYAVSVDTIEALSLRFFGRSISEAVQDAGASGALRIKDGKVCFPAADGETYNRLTVLDQAVEQSDGSIKVDFSIYSTDIDESIVWPGRTIHNKSLYYFTPEEAAGHAMLHYEHGGEAVIQPYTAENGTEAFLLVSYQIEK